MDDVPSLLDAVESRATVLQAGTRTYDGKRFAQTVYKTGNFLRHCGVHDGAVVEILPAAAPETVFGLLGTALLGGQVRFEPGTRGTPKARLGPTDELNATEPTPGCKFVGFGKPPDEPSWAYFEREIWSENPFFPDVDLDPDRPFVQSGGAVTSVAELFEAAATTAREFDEGAVVAVRAHLSTPGVIASGVLAPLIARGTVLFPDEEQVGTIAVADGPAPEERTIEPRF